MHAKRHSIRPERLGRVCHFQLHKQTDGRFQRLNVIVAEEDKRSGEGKERAAPTRQTAMCGSCAPAFSAAEQELESELCTRRSIFETQEGRVNIRTLPTLLGVSSAWCGVIYYGCPD